MLGFAAVEHQRVSRRNREGSFGVVQVEAG
jgi:hypothetical protein